MTEPWLQPLRELVVLAEACLHSAPHKRPTAKEVLDTLERLATRYGDQCWWPTDSDNTSAKDVHELATSKQDPDVEPDDIVAPAVASASDTADAFPSAGRGAVLFGRSFRNIFGLRGPPLKSLPELDPFAMRHWDTPSSRRSESDRDEDSSSHTDGAATTVIDVDSIPGRHHRGGAMPRMPGRSIASHASNHASNKLVVSPTVYTPADCVTGLHDWR